MLLLSIVAVNSKRLYRPKTRSLGQILLKSCLQCRGHIFDPISLKLALNVCLDDISVKCDHGWDWVKSKSLGQILVKSCLPSRGHNIDAVFFKLAQNVWLRIQT